MNEPRHTTGGLVMRSVIVGAVLVAVPGCGDREPTNPTDPPSSFAFTREADPIQFTGGTPLFEAAGLIGDPDVTYIDGRFRLYASLARALPGGGSTVVIAVAESDDGRVFNFIRTEDDAVLDLTESFEYFGIETVAVVEWNGTQHSYYATYEDGRPEVARIALATGANGLDLQKQGIVLPYDLSWEEPWTLGGVEGDAVGGVIEPTVVANPTTGRLHMYYNALGLLDGAWTLPVGLATSTDGTTWSKRSTPIIDRPHERAEWSHRAVHHPDVIYLEDSQWWVMAYTGRDLDHMDTDPSHIRLAFSRDGVTWHAVADNIAIAPRAGTWEEREVLAPALQRVGDTVHLFYWGKASGPDGRWSIGRATMATDSVAALAAHTISASTP